MYNTFIGNKNKDHKDVGIGKIFFFFFFAVLFLCGVLFHQ